MSTPTSVMPWMGPPAFQFSMSEGPLAGSAFSTAFKVLATVIVGGCAAALIQIGVAGQLNQPATAGVTVANVGLSWFAAGLLLMGVTWWNILRSVTRLDADGLHQSWVWNKHMALRDLAYAKLIRVRGLDWLIAPRLYVRTLDGKFAVFYAASPQLLAGFEQLASSLKAFRHPH